MVVVVDPNPNPNPGVRVYYRVRFHTAGYAQAAGYPVWKFIYLDPQNPLDPRIQARGCAPQNRPEDSPLSYLS